MTDSGGIWLAGVDGCRGGWVVAFARPESDVARPRVGGRCQRWACVSLGLMIL
jgi:predicted RNase H-like nuclease